MCDSREQFVVPVRPAACMGWWIGHVLSERDGFYEVNVLWVENPQYNGPLVISSTNRYVRLFDTQPEAVESLPPGVFSQPAVSVLA